jgi:arabinose-5-phosphate isomerase
MLKNISYRQTGKKVVEVELASIATLIDRIDIHFDRACHLLFSCCGRIIVTGMGKSGHIGGKIAATLASTGSPSFFVHPGEASHGDLGMITQSDVVLAISQSGETDEIITILPLIKRLGVPLIAMTGNTKSTMARMADIHLDTSVQEEACPLGLAPTSSTTTALVMGDALAVALLEARGFTREDFAFSHPGGSLGRKLLLRVSDIMHTKSDLPAVQEKASLREALLEMTAKKLGITAIVNSENRTLGIFTDGDLRRLIERGDNLDNANIASVMTFPGARIRPDALAAEALRVMENKRINALLVTNSAEELLGAINMHDLLRAGIF